MSCAVQQQKSANTFDLSSRGMSKYDFLFRLQIFRGQTGDKDENIKNVNHFYSER